TATPSPTPIPAVRVDQADRWTIEGNFTRAIEENTTALEASTDAETQAAALYGIGRAQYLYGNCIAAVQALTTVTEQYPNSSARANAFFLLAECYRSQNNPTAAVTAYRQYLTLRPAVLDAFVQERIGDTLLESGDAAGAVPAFEAAQASAPSPAAVQTLDVKIGRAYAAQSDHINAVRKFMAVYESAADDYLKAQMNFLSGQSYLALGLPDQAYARFQDSVVNYPKAYDSYSGLVALVDAGIPVSDLDRGIVDYYARQYGLALDALTRYLDTTPDHNGTAHYFKGLSLYYLGDYAKSLQEWQALIDDHGGDRFWRDAWDEKAYTLWTGLNQYKQAAETLQAYVALMPGDEKAGDFLYEAARILERGNDLEGAALQWEKLMDQYPASELSSRGLFLAGVTRYRMQQYPQALTIFQRAQVLASTPAEQAQALFWIGKTQQAQNDPAAARQSWEQSAQRDPGSYYSIRARDILLNEPPLAIPSTYDLTVNWDEERRLAELWLRSTFAVPAETDLTILGPLGSDSRMVRGTALWELGFYRLAAQEFESLRTEVTLDPVANYRLMNHLLDLGFYRPAIFISRQILTLANLDGDAAFTAPNYFNHVRFGPYYSEAVVEAAQKEGFSPLLLLSVIRQESFFEGFAQSSAGAVGLMQVLPDTGQEIASEIGWPANYTRADLLRPQVSIRFGSHYLRRWRDYFGGDLYALAAYNGGPGNAITWKDLSGEDPDLFLEVIRAAETRQYVLQITEFMNIYRRYYTVEP
ncbi:tetratricopeptide repeat protein, partial [Levilinea saccharolytica]